MDFLGWISILKRERLKREIPVYKMADMIRVTHPTIARLESEPAGTRLETFARYCHQLGYSLEIRKIKNNDTLELELKEFPEVARRKYFEKYCQSLGYKLVEIKDEQKK